MREILFRGKRTDNGEWVYGFCEILNEKLAYIRTPRQIYTDVNMVILESISEFTGLTDKNSKKIFEGDIVECFSSDYVGHPKIDTFTVKDMTDYNTMVYLNCSNELKVIGNIHDKPEPPKEGADNG